MQSDAIEKFIENKNRKDVTVNIHFKERETVKGLFIRGTDYDELKSKNFWRIVSSTYLAEWNKTHNVSLARIFNGMSFTRLTEEKPH
jgi:hypothetical protein